MQKQVFEFLTQKPHAIEGARQMLQSLAWESLAYLESDSMLQVSDLQQAVPDYYNFMDSVVIIKLINPESFNEYGVEVKSYYRIEDEEKILLVDQESGIIRDEWRIIGLDKNYLGLEMGGIKVFFIHTPQQE